MHVEVTSPYAPNSSLSNFVMAESTSRFATLSEEDLRANAQKNRAKTEIRGHSRKPNLPSFSVCR